MPFSSCVYLIGQVYAIQFLCIFDRPSLCHSVLVYLNFNTCVPFSPCVYVIGQVYVIQFLIILSP